MYVLQFVISVTHFRDTLECILFAQSQKMSLLFPTVPNFFANSFSFFVTWLPFYFFDMGIAINVDFTSNVIFSLADFWVLILDCDL